jgi:hypothetical protein
MTARLWILVLLGWLSIGGTLPAHAAPICARVEANPFRGGATSSAPREAVRVLPDHPALCQAAQRLRARQLRLDFGPCPWLPDAAGLFDLPGSGAFSVLSSSVVLRTTRGRPFAPRAPPSSR